MPATLPEPRAHGKNLTETAHGRRNTKSFILLGYDVLKRYGRNQAIPLLLRHGPARDHL